MASASGTCRIIVLGSTGSIGTQTLEVIAHLNALNQSRQWPTRYEVAGLAAASNAALLRQQADRFGTRHVALENGAAAGWDQGGAGTAVFSGADAARQLVETVECHMVVAAISGAAGLPATLAAIERGRDIALANKETLVAAGAIIVPAAIRSGSRLFPVDSEHSALWQCLRGTPAPDDESGRSDAAPPMECPPSVDRIILTASGGPFRTWTQQAISTATPEQALKHPVWNMGPKVTVDCASLTNKALEVIEAHWLFGIPGDRIQVVIHPQSIIHSLVEFADGSTIAQLGSPDMRGPIQYAITRGQRTSGIARRIDWRELRSLEFEQPDPVRFPALGLAWRAIAEGGAAGAILNAANEAAVQAFLGGRIEFGRIPGLVAQAMDEVPSRSLASLDDVLRADREARHFIAGCIGD